VSDRSSMTPLVRSLAPEARLECGRFTTRYTSSGAVSERRANVVSDMQSMERTLSGAMSERYAKNVCKNKNARTLGSPLVSLMITH
jgi:hypothetical protein